MKKDQRGFIALTSVLIISAILVVLIYTLDLSAFFSRFDALDAENKRVSRGLAEACINAAMLKIAQNGNYMPAQGGDCVSIEDTCGLWGAQKTCRICEITTSGVWKTIAARAAYNGSFTNLGVTMSAMPGNFAVTVWNELGAYSGPPCVVP